MYNIYNINDIYLPNIVDDDPSNTGNPYISINEDMSVNKSNSVSTQNNALLNKHLSVFNNGDFICNFNVSYSSNEHYFSLDSGDFSSSFTRQLSIPIDVNDVYLIINIINSSGNFIPIYKKSISINSDIIFTLNGDVHKVNINKKY